MLMAVMKFVIRQWLALSLLVALVLPASAEIYEWRDDAGDRHFTNSMNDVPADEQAAVRVIVTEAPAQGDKDAKGDAGELPCATQSAEASTPAPRLAQVVYGNPESSPAYAEGVRDALMALAGDRSAEGRGSVQINGPLAVNNSNAGGLAYGYGGFGAFPWYYPFVTTGFDRGRSRFLTLRLLLQDQFQLDRDGPFAFERFPQIGIGPGLDPFLPRGLPPPHAPVYEGNVLFR